MGGVAVMRRAMIVGVLVSGAVLAACSSGGTDAVDVRVPDDATFCSVFEGQYDRALARGVPATDDSFGDRAAEITAWAQVLVDLAPDEVLMLAEDNLAYHGAQEAKESAAEFTPGSNEMHAWARDNCGDSPLPDQGAPAG